jgi:hypothetical protein
MVGGGVGSAGELSVKIADGRATVIAKEVPVRQILAEWARVGNTQIVNAEKLMGPPVSIELINVPEKEALDILLRTAAGYITAPRPASVAGASQFDRVIVLATSRAPAATASAPPPSFGRAAIQQMPPQPPPDDDDGEPSDQGAPPPVIGPNGPMQPFPGANGASVNGPNQMPMGSPNQFPGVQQQPPSTAPRPGMLPAAPQPGVPTPSATGTGRGGRGGEGGQQ